VQDDSGQLSAAKRQIGRCVAQGQSLFVPVTETVELEWVLRTSFGYAKDNALQALSQLTTGQCRAVKVFELGKWFLNILSCMNSRPLQ